MKRGVWKVYPIRAIPETTIDSYSRLPICRTTRRYWFKKYDGDKVGNNAEPLFESRRWKHRVTANMDDYLTIDGKPFVGELSVLRLKRQPDNRSAYGTRSTLGTDDLPGAAVASRRCTPLLTRSAAAYRFLFLQSGY